MGAFTGQRIHKCATILWWTTHRLANDSTSWLSELLLKCVSSQSSTPAFLVLDSFRTSLEMLREFTLRILASQASMISVRSWHLVCPEIPFGKVPQAHPGRSPRIFSRNQGQKKSSTKQQHENHRHDLMVSTTQREIPRNFLSIKFQLAPDLASIMSSLLS